jgi:uncharacterized membrane protein YfcA
MSPIEIIVSSIIVAIAACIQGSIGFGLAMLAAPLLVLIEPDLVPAPLIVNGLLLTFLMAYRERKAIDVSGVVWMSTGCVPGIVAASIVLTVISADGFTILFSILVLLAVVLGVLGYSIRFTKTNVLIAGTFSGFMGTTSSIGGPPVALIYQNTPGVQMRGTLSAYFFICGILALIGLFFVGWFGIDELWLALSLLPGLIIGFAVSSITTGKLDQYSLRPAGLGLSAMAAIAVLARALL